MNDELRTAQIEIAATLYAANRKPSIAVAYVALLCAGLIWWQVEQEVLLLTL